MKNAPHPQSARVFMNWLIGKDVITYRAERFLQAPMNSKVRLPAEAAKMVVMGEDNIKKLKNLDWRTILPQRAKWVERFDKEIATIPRAR